MQAGRLRTVVGHLSKPAVTLSTMRNSKEPYPLLQPAMGDLPKSKYIKLSTHGTARIIELNRPEKLHALNLEMVLAITDAMRIWSKSPSCNFILLKSSPEGLKTKAFCTGGDITSITKMRGQLGEQVVFFRTEYALNHFLGTYPKPLIAILDGITMGGGAGLSVHGQYRIATENAFFSMPETIIGFFPDVGGSFFLPRLEGYLGTYLALTGKRLKGIDVYHAGIATHYVPSSRLDDLCETLCSSNFDPGALGGILEQFSGEYEPASYEDILSQINHCFSPDNVLEIIRRLKDAANDPDKRISSWAKEALELMAAGSPTSLAATLELVRCGESLSFKNCLNMEYNLTKNMLELSHDVYEGVTTKFITKTFKTDWKPSRVEDVDPLMIASLFRPNKSITNQLEFWTNDDYEWYPHQDNALPTTRRIRQLVEANRNLPSREVFIEEICRALNWKMGLKELLERVSAEHVRTRAELESLGHVAVCNLTWVPK